MLEYVVTVTNIAAVPAPYVVITDDLDAAQTGYLTYVDQSATMNGSTAGVSFAGSVITADYATHVRHRSRRARPWSCGSVR